jgi:hypothetical protein
MVSMVSMVLLYKLSSTYKSTGVSTDGKLNLAKRENSISSTILQSSLTLTDGSLALI